MRSPKLRAGDLVEVRSRAEILATLDADGCIDGMPFMAEMLRYCGQRLRVSKVAHKTCDTATKTGGRWLKDIVHLEDTRCDGAAHGGCEAACLLFWKTHWLKKIDAAAPQRAPANDASSPAVLEQFASRREAGETIYRCQATQLPLASRLLRWWDIRQYIADVTSGNESFGRVARVLVLSWCRALMRLGIGYRIFRSLHDSAHRALMGQQSPLGCGRIPSGTSTPSVELNLRAGERVRVRSHEEILATLDAANNKNRGMRFDAEMVPYCGREYRVARRVNRLIDESNGRMVQMKNSCIVLDGVVCKSQYSQDRLLCPRAITPYWREIWLQRVAAQTAPAPQAAPADAATD